MGPERSLRCCIASIVARYTIPQYTRGWRKPRGNPRRPAAHQDGSLRMGRLVGRVRVRAPMHQRSQARAREPPWGKMGGAPPPRARLPPGARSSEKGSGFFGSPLDFHRGEQPVGVGFQPIHHAIVGTIRIQPAEVLKVCKARVAEVRAKLVNAELVRGGRAAPERAGTDRERGGWWARGRSARLPPRTSCALPPP